MKSVFVAFLLSLSICFSFLHAQTDEINISAAFSNFIDLRVTGGASIQFTFTTINQYQNGIVDNNGSYIEIASSTDFELYTRFTPFVDGAGNEIAPKNLTYLVTVPEARSSEEGVRWNFGTPQENFRSSGTTNGRRHSAGFYASQTEVKVLEPGSEGNAGTYEDNQFGIWWRLGYSAHMRALGMPPLLEQNIAPGTYTTTMTITAMPIAL